MPNLFVSASVSDLDGIRISATGIGETPDEATLRHDAERAERFHLARTGLAGGALIGMAAGRDAPDRIGKRAADELIERWLCNGWWAGRVRQVQPSWQIHKAFKAALTTWPRRTSRRTGLCQLSAHGSLAVCVAWSCDAEGTSLCFGTACDDRGETAARRALFELYQMEFGLSVIRHRARNGVALSGREKRVLDRATNLSFAAIKDRLLDRFDHEEPAGDGFLPDLEIEFEDCCAGDHHIVLARPRQVDAAKWSSRTDPAWPLYGGG